MPECLTWLMPCVLLLLLLLLQVAKHLGLPVSMSFELPAGAFSAAITQGFDTVSTASQVGASWNPLSSCSLSPCFVVRLCCHVRARVSRIHQLPASLPVEITAGVDVLP
jgi:phosphate/sulfate permease